MLLFSIVVPVYNVIHYIDDCIQSIISQSFLDYEIIIVDDGSTDGSSEICDSIGEKNSRISVIHQKNKGLSEARNTGIKYSRGKYIVFVDSDDMLFPDSLYNLKTCILNNDYPDIIINRRACVGEDEIIRECKYYFDDTLYNKCNTEVYKNLQRMEDCWLGAWIFVLDSKFIKLNDLLFYPGILHEDEEWVPRVILSEGEIGYNNNILYVNRLNRPDSITSNPNIKRIIDKLKIIDLLLDYYVFNSPIDTDKQNVIINRVAAILFGIICDLHLYENSPQYNSVINDISKKVWVLKDCSEQKYKALWLSINMIGIKRTSHIVNKLKGIL